MKTSAILWSLAFAIGIVASAFVFHGKTEYWVESVLIIAALGFVILRKRTA